MSSKSKGQRCPRCGSKDVLLQDTLERNVRVFVCLDCDHEFTLGGSTESKRTDDRRWRREATDDAK